MTKFFALFIFLSLISCTKKNLFVSDQKGSSKLRTGFVGVPHLNWVSALKNHQEIASLLQEPLLDLQIRDGKLQVVAKIVEKWEYTSPTSFRFTLNRNIQWEGGATLGAAHLIQSWKELLLAYPENQNASLLFCIANAKNFAERRSSFSSVGIQSGSTQTIDLKFHVPCPNFPYLLSHLSLSPRKNFPWSLAKGSFLPKPLDSLGEWKLESYWPSHEITLKQNSFLTRESSSRKVGSLSIHFYDDLNHALSVMEDNQEDIVLGEDILVPNSVTSSGSFPTLNTIVLVFNSYRRPFQNSKMRQMFSGAIQKEELLRLGGTPFDEAHRLLPFLEGEFKKTELSHTSSKVNFSDAKLGNLSLSVQKDPLLMEVAKNLTAQWKKNLGVDVEIVSGGQETFSMALQNFRPDFYKKALGLEEWAKFSSSDFLSPLFSSLLTVTSAEPFNIYQSRLIKMEQWVVEEEKLVFPLLTRRKHIFYRNGFSGVQYKSARDVYDFNAVEKN